MRHSGLVETGTACIFILPESGIAIAITANVNDYFVTNEMMDSLGWGVVLMLLGDQPNEIKSSDYILSHVRIDMIMSVVLAFAPDVFITVFISFLLLSVGSIIKLSGYDKKYKDEG